MRPRIDLTDAERTAVESYANKEGYTMEHAYGQLIRDSLYARYGIDFNWGDNGEFMLVYDTDSMGTGAPISEPLPKEGAYVVNAEFADHLENAGLDYPEHMRLDNATWGLKHD